MTVGVSERVNPLSVTTSSLRLYDYAVGDYVAGTVAVSADLRTLTFTPSAPLRVSGTYQVSVSGVEDLAGNTLFASSTFTTSNAP